MADMNRAGTYELLEFRIAPFDRNFEDTNAFIDIRGLIHEWELNESMDSGHIYGTAVVYDSLGILDDFQIKTDPVNHWIKGEERIRIRYKDWYPDHEPMEHEMFLYSVTDVQPITTAKEALRVYKIHFVSIDKFLTERFLVRRGFRDKLISENVEDIFKEYWNRQGNNYRRLPKKDLYLEETTEGKQNLVVPNYSPEQTMHFFARKAYAGEGKTQIWRFFENRKAYFFITHDTLAAEANALEAFSGEIQKYVRINIGDKTPGTEAITMQSILDIRQPTYINTLKDMLTGAYYSSLTELDIPNRTPTFVEYRYLDEYENLETTSYLKADKKYGVAPRPRHSKKFVDEHLNTLRDRLVVRDYGSPNDPGGGAFVRPETFYTDVYNDKRVSYNHHDSNKILMKIYGNNEVMAGSIIEIDLLKLDNDTENPKTDELRSGRYLVESVKNIFKEELYYQELTISAAGVYAKPERANEYVRERLPLSEFTERETFFNESDGGRDVDGTRRSDDTPASANTEDIPPDNRPTSEKELAAMEYFISQGYTPEQAAGIVGNLTKESGMRTDARNPNDGGPGKDSVGLAQWNRERLEGLERFAGERGTSKYDFETQLAYVDYELRNSERTAGNSLRGSTDAGGAALAMTRYERFKGYEQGSNSPESKGRIAAAKRLLNDYNNK
jgi:hypothetical protein